MTGCGPCPAETGYRAEAPQPVTITVAADSDATRSTRRPKNIPTKSGVNPTSSEKCGIADRG